MQEFEIDSRIHDIFQTKNFWLISGHKKIFTIKDGEVEKLPKGYLTVSQDNKFIQHTSKNNRHYLDERGKLTTNIEKAVANIGPHPKYFGLYIYCNLNDKIFTQDVYSEHIYWAKNNFAFLAAFRIDKPYAFVFVDVENKRAKATSFEIDYNMAVFSNDGSTIFLYKSGAEKSHILILDNPLLEN